MMTFEKDYGLFHLTMYEAQNVRGASLWECAVTHATRTVSRLPCCIAFSYTLYEFVAKMAQCVALCSNFEQLERRF
jgi:hypothetical protein